VVTLKLATIVGNDNPFTTSAYKFKEIAEAKSGGRLKIEVYPAGQLTKNEIVAIEGMQLGTVDIAAVSLPSAGGKFDPKLLAPDVPFLYQNREHVWRVMDGPVGKELMKHFEPLGAKAFCYGGGFGFRGVLSNKRPVFVPDDLKGQTIRVPPIPTLVEVFKQFGANPVPMIWGEVYMAVRQGTVDGLELPVTTAVSDKFHEITKYYSKTQHSYPAAAWLMAKAKYDGLPADLKKVIDETMTASVPSTARTAEGGGGGPRGHEGQGHAGQRGEGPAPLPGARPAGLEVPRAEGGQGAGGSGDRGGAGHREVACSSTGSAWD
jgi:tripartite ATP-independent transporter DctP family solute receptor